ncbi:MAG: M23 family metallopeptidase [Pyrinomonadaceae bacterium]|nr:M23 family metallopeptidase [Pyrinomonadaceae bacterium]
MKRLVTILPLIVLMFAALQIQTRTQTNSKKDEPPIDCDAFPAQVTSLYILPYKTGESYKVIAATEHYNRGNKGVGLNAIDFQMPIGTSVVAARAGIVVAIQEDYSDNNGVDLQENYAFIKHSDGSIGRYFHLTQKGALVEVGDSVRQGDVIARSGNSGQSDVPHLHFDVQMCGLNLPPNYNQLPCGQTLPVTFRNTSQHACGLVTGRSYLARSLDSQKQKQKRRTSRSNRKL